MKSCYKSFLGFLFVAMAVVAVGTLPPVAHAQSQSEARGSQSKIAENSLEEAALEDMVDSLEQLMAQPGGPGTQDSLDHERQCNAGCSGFICIYFTYNICRACFDVCDKRFIEENTQYA